MFRAILAGRCAGISFLTQLSNTPLGAMIRAALILFASCRIAIVSMTTFVLPVPISMNKA